MTEQKRSNGLSGARPAEFTAQPGNVQSPGAASRQELQALGLCGASLEKLGREKSPGQVLCSGGLGWGTKKLPLGS